MKKKPTPKSLSLSAATAVNVADVAAEMTDELDRFSAWKDKLIEDPNILGGEPVFPKSRTAVRNVGGLLLRGAPDREVREDFPHLTDEDLEFARRYATAYPKMAPRRSPRRTVPLADFKADPAKVTQMAADGGPVSVVNPSGETVWRVSVPKAEPEDC